MRLEDLHTKEFLLMTETERLNFMQEYRTKRTIELETVRAKAVKKSGTVKKIKMDSNALAEARKLGLV